MWLRKGVNVEVDKTPGLKKSMDSYYCTCISTNMTPASCGCQVLGRIFPVELDHKVSSLHICLGRLRRKLVAEVFRARFFFDFMYMVEVKPLSARRNDIGLPDPN